MSKQLDKAKDLLARIIEGNYNKVNTFEIECVLRSDIEDFLTDNY